MSIFTTNYLPIQTYLTRVASNAKLNLSTEQQKTFQEVLAETTQELTKEAVKTNVLPLQQNDIWKSIGAAGMYSSGFSDLLMSGIYGNTFSSSMNPLATLTTNKMLTTSNYLSHLYYPSSNITNLYKNLQTIQQKL